MLQAIEDEHKGKGLAVLAVSLDSPEERSKIPKYLKKFGLRSHVLLAEVGQLEGYDDQTLGQLYLIDRSGLLAGLPGDFEGDFRRKVEAGIKAALKGAPTQGRVILAADKVPNGFRTLWKRMLGENASALAVAPSAGGHPAEIGLISDTQLLRFSPSGEPLGEAPLPGSGYRKLTGVDLDGDGENEWIAEDDVSFSLVNSRGEPYWYYRSTSTSHNLAGFRDLDGDGWLEIVIKDGSSVAAKKALPGLLWQTPPLGALRSVVLDPGGALLAQMEDGLRTLDPRGVPTGGLEPITGKGTLAGRIGTGEDHLDVYRDSFGGRVVITDNLARSGKQEVLVLGSSTATAFSQEGKVLLRLWVGENRGELQAAAGDLDGRPGDELVLFIPRYGLVALGAGAQADTTPAAASSDSGAMLRCAR